MAKSKPRASQNNLSIVFDLDGTLVDSVYEHVVTWKQALNHFGLPVPGALIHRKIGMSGDLLVRLSLKELGLRASDATIAAADKLHGKLFAKRVAGIKPLPGAVELLKTLSAAGARWAIGTGGDKKTVASQVICLRVPKAVAIVTGDDVSKAKPEPDIFVMAAERLASPLANTLIVGDSTWDLLATRRAGALGIGLLCGGYSRAELEAAGAYRVYNDPHDLLVHLGEIGFPEQ